MSIINKLMGFLELNNIGIPSVPWKSFIPGETQLDGNCLWTIRTAVLQGDDFNLPRLVGANANEASDFATKLCNQYKDEALIIYYPFFNALKSGTLEVRYNGYIIESVEADLWNLVTEGKRNQTIIANDGNTNIIGEENFLSQFELEQLKSNYSIVRAKFAKSLRDGETYLLEWSFAVNVTVNRQPTGDEYLVFYECRTI